MEMLPAIATSLLSHVPVYVVWIVGIVFAVIRWNRHSRVSLFLLLALVPMLFLSILGMAVSMSLPLYLRREGIEVPRLSLILGVWSLVLSTLQAGCWVLFLIALFGWRGAPAQTKAAPIS